MINIAKTIENIISTKEKQRYKQVLKNNKTIPGLENSFEIPVIKIDNQNSLPEGFSRVIEPWPQLGFAKIENNKRFNLEEVLKNIENDFNDILGLPSYIVEEENSVTYNKYLDILEGKTSENIRTNLEDDIKTENSLYTAERMEILGLLQELPDLDSEREAELVYRPVRVSGPKRKTRYTSHKH